MGLFNFFKKKPLHTSDELLEWQHALGYEDSYLKYTESQLLSISTPIFNRNLEIVNDCINIINETCDINTFFYRYELLLDKLLQLSILEKFIPCSGNSPSSKLDYIHQKQCDIINSFIDRYWDKVLTKANSLKTQKGKENRYNNYLSSFEPYKEKLPGTCIAYYKSKIPEVN